MQVSLFRSKIFSVALPAHAGLQGGDNGPMRLTRSEHPSLTPPKSTLDPRVRGDDDTRGVPLPIHPMRPLLTTAGRTNHEQRKQADAKATKRETGR